MTLREWLLLIGAVILVVIVVDGYRRAKRSKRDSMEMSMGMGSVDNSPLDEGFNPELPNGGARVVTRESNEAPARPPSRPPEQAPVKREPAIAATPADEPLAEPSVERNPVEPVISSLEDDDFEAEAPAMRAETRAKPAAVAPRATGKKKATNKPLSGDKIADKSGEQAPKNQEVIVINVLAKGESGFAGEGLEAVVKACGMSHGRMGIFHRLNNPDDPESEQFSMANAVEPGTFDPETMAEMSTPGVVFFMSLPLAGDSMEAFDFMLETARSVMRNLDGELKDERRSVLTAQTIEHYRQRIRDFERKQLSLRL